jgi:hypothetical protein
MKMGNCGIRLGEIEEIGIAVILAAWKIFRY